MSTFEAQLVDRIVRDVMARLAGGGNGVNGGEVQSGVLDSQSPLPSSQSPVPASSDDALVLDDAVLTEDSLAVRINGHRSIVVGPRTVLTPTARDFLRKRAIKVTREGVDSKTSAGGARLAIVVTESATALSAIEATHWKHEIDDCWKRVAKAIGRKLRDGVEGAVVFAKQAAGVACLANRDPRVRATTIDDLAGLRWARKQIGPNVIVVDPVGKSFVTLREILRDFAAERIVTPDGWED